MRPLRALVFACPLFAAMPAQSQETLTYSYDVLGRLQTVSSTGNPASARQTTYALDAAGNRTAVTTTGMEIRVVVIPTNGFTVIPLAER